MGKESQQEQQPGLVDLNQTIPKNLNLPPEPVTAQNLKSKAADPDKQDRPEIDDLPQTPELGIVPPQSNRGDEIVEILPVPPNLQHHPKGSPFLRKIEKTYIH